MTVPGWPVAFRGSHAIAAGLVTRGRLRGPRYRRLLPDVYCRAAGGLPDLLLRSLAAYRLVEALANRHRFPPDRLLELHARDRDHRGVARVPDVVTLASPYAGSPMETRLRLLIIRAGLPPPRVQWVVQDPATRTTRLVDLGWRMYRYTKQDMYGNRGRLIAELTRARSRST